MAAAPQKGTLLFQGESGRVHSYSFYASDVANAFIKWATTGAAGTGSVDFITAPENMTLVDASVVTGLTDTTALVLWLDDGPVPGTVISDANIVNTIQKRAFPPLGIRKGRKVQLQQV